MKKIGLIILVAVLALGAMGAGYALWTQSFNIGGNVASGTYIVSIAQSPAASVSPTQSVATCSIGTVTPTGSGAGIPITISNGFPGLTYTVPFTLTDSGTVPAKITGFTFQDGSGTPVTYTSGNVTFTLSDGGSPTPDTFTVNAQITGLAVNDVIPANSASPAAGTLIVTIPSTLTTGDLATHNGSFNFVVNTSQQY
jgi:hypothetical protein